MTALVFAPAVSFHVLSQTLATLGWQRLADPTAPEPLIAGEPELASFARASEPSDPTDAARLEPEPRLDYVFEPAIGLRRLSSHGPWDPATLAALRRELPCLRLDDARRLLATQAVESRLLGIHVAEALDGYGLIATLLALSESQDVLIAEHAARTAQRLIARAGDRVLPMLAEWQRAHPDQSVAFRLLDDSRPKLQVLRWFVRDRERSNAHIDGVLRTALVDDDWEVRVTGMVVAGYLRASGVRSEVSKVQLPDDLASGVNADERRMLRSFQLAALERMDGAPVPPPLVPPPLSTPPTDKQTMHRHILRCLALADANRPDGASGMDGTSGMHATSGMDASAGLDGTRRYLEALLLPLPDTWPGPDPLPPGVIARDGGYVLEAHDMALCWVPPIAHRLGEALPRLADMNPIREVRSQGFFISEGLAGSPLAPSQAGEPATPWLCDQNAALAAARSLADATGLPVRLPTPAEWEMAARGPDGRRFPWGNNAQAHGRLGPSPWGMHDAVGRLPQWTVETTGQAYLYGGPRQWACAMGQPAEPNAEAAVRWVIPGSPSTGVVHRS